MTENNIDAEATLRGIPDGRDVVLKMKDGSERKITKNSDDAGETIISGDDDSLDLTQVEDVLLEDTTDGPE
jgi:hypothetical protein